MQPTKEILESNYQKIKQTGFRGATIFSASCNEKRIGKATYGTIGSVIKHIERFRPLEAIIVDEAHLTNARGGQYDDFIKALDPPMLIGLTATPYRLYTNREWGSSVKMLHRTRPRIFRDILHVTQCSELAATGYLHRPSYVVSEAGDTSILQANTTGNEYTEDSIRSYLSAIDAPGRILAAAQDAVGRGRQHLLIFTPTLAESAKAVVLLNDVCIKSETVSAKTSKRERSLKLARFRSGMTMAMVNVGILTTGFDFPRLDCIISARPTMSLALYYQIIGRGVRPSPSKDELLVYDLVDNYSRFGDPVDMRIVADATGQYDVLSATGRLTGRDILAEPETQERIRFGRFKGQELQDVDTEYLEQYCRKCKLSPTWHMFNFELLRRRIWKPRVNGELMS